MINTRVAIFAFVGAMLAQPATAADGPPPLPGDAPGAIVTPAPEKAERIEPARPAKKVQAAETAKVSMKARKGKAAHPQGKSTRSSSKPSGHPAASQPKGGKAAAAKPKPTHKKQAKR
ncbi:hypothetical protein ABWL39_14235 [Chitinivorax sp. PXF-14]|uniref:hypothetical protein n=1 Tax=Chitinivorax sp. PXF-14 TaxID=3230488 RepID=UPI00346685E7